jgi:hypothetical protein
LRRREREYYIAIAVTDPEQWPVANANAGS